MLADAIFAALSEIPPSPLSTIISILTVHEIIPETYKDNDDIYGAISELLRSGKVGYVAKNNWEEDIFFLTTRTSLPYLSDSTPVTAEGK